MLAFHRLNDRFCISLSLHSRYSIEFRVGEFFDSREILEELRDGDFFY